MRWDSKIKRRKQYSIARGGKRTRIFSDGSAAKQTPCGHELQSNIRIESAAGHAPATHREAGEQDEASHVWKGENRTTSETKLLRKKKIANKTTKTKQTSANFGKISRQITSKPTSKNSLTRKKSPRIYSHAANPRSDRGSDQRLRAQVIVRTSLAT
jgi:hypothetical protein